MNNYYLGCTYALITSMIFAIYIIPKKFTKISPIYYSFYVGTGFFSSSLILFGAKYFLNQINENILDVRLLYAFLGGVLWGIGTIFLLKSIDKIGIAKSNQWKNLQGPIGIILSILILSEYLHTNILFTILAGTSIFISALLLNVNDKNNKSGNLVGVMYATFSALFFGIVAVINKYLTNNGLVYSQLVIWSFSVLFSIFIFILINKKHRKFFLKVKDKDKLLGFLGGFLYFLAGVFMLISYLYIPASVGFTIIQLNSLWVILMGIFIFKEINFKENFVRILLALIFAISSMILIFFAKN